MNYQESLEYLKSLGNEILDGRLGLDTMRRLLEAMGNPHRQFEAVLIAGTNGKGSIAHFIHSILTEAGISSGLFTSPHLDRVQERVSIGGVPISPEDFAGCIARVVAASARAKPAASPTYFETLTAAAFDHFARNRIEIAVLEVGMGGRLDSTNVVDPVLTVIAPVGFDHQPYLGNSLQEIAWEKAGTIHPHRPLLTARQNHAVRRILQARARSLNSEYWELEPRSLRNRSDDFGRPRFEYRGLSFKLRLCGAHQAENAALAVEAALRLNGLGYRIDSGSLVSGISRTTLPGRIERISGDPEIVLDGAHNPHSILALCEFLERHTRAPRSLIFSMMADKDLTRVSGLLSPHFSQILTAPIASRRSADIDRLQSLFSGAGKVRNLDEAFQASRTARTVVVAGSFSLAAMARRQLGLAHSS